jgi:PAS domain S-box-containing protein
MSEIHTLQYKINALEQLLDAQEKSIIEQTDKLVESEARFRAIFDGSNDALMLFAEQSFFDCNPRTLEMFGFKDKEEFTRIHPADISPPNQPDGTESFPAAQESIKTAFEQGSNRFEWVHRRKNGEDFPAEVLLSAFTLNGKRVLQATVRDISKRKRAEEALQKSEAMLRGIYSAAPVGIAVSYKRTMKTVNGWLCEISGFSQDELTGTNARIFFPDDAEYERVGRELYKNSGEGSPNNVEARWQRKDGALIDVLINSAPIDPADPGAGEVVSVLDITSLKQAQRSLVESENSFRSMFEMTSEGVVLVNPRTDRFFAANPAMCAMFGYTEEEFHSLTPEDITPTEFKDVMRQSMQNLYRNEMTPDHEGASLKKDGTLIYSIVGSRLLPWKGEMVGYITFKNVTFLKEIQEQLNKKNAEILEFTDTIVHDLKKPLTAMKTICGLTKIRAVASGDADFIEATEIGAQSIRYMQEMLDDLLACAKLEAGTQELAVEDVRCKDILAQVERQLKYAVEEKKIVLDIPADDLCVRADPKQLTRVFMNLVGNAINYIGDKPDRKISVGWENHGGSTVFTVQDNGIGIPRESQSQLFTKFKRGTNVSGISGTGLGLSIVKGIVLAHGGRIWFESREGEGTAFHFTLG